MSYIPVFMNLYVDESGNTGETLSKELQFNFTDQSYYVLAGILVDEEEKTDLEDFLTDLKRRHRIQADELKASKIYQTKPKVISELVEYIHANQIPFFIELMDKVYYLDTQIVAYFLAKSLPFNNENIALMNGIASTIGQRLNANLYQAFTNTCKTYTNEALESFYDLLINKFQQDNERGLAQLVLLTKNDYLEAKESDPQTALQGYLPIPDENHRERLLHLLPNFNALTNLIARVNKFNLNRGITDFTIIHDEQPHFETIFRSALEQLKTIDTDSLAAGTEIQEKATYNIDNSIRLEFSNSKSAPLIQVADILAGFVMRYWGDFKNENDEKLDQYNLTMKRLIYPFNGNPVGVNFVVSNIDHFRFIETVRN